jgi:hypothetical protein
MRSWRSSDIGRLPLGSFADIRRAERTVRSSTGSGHRGSDLGFAQTAVVVAVGLLERICQSSIFGTISGIAATEPWSPIWERCMRSWLPVALACVALSAPCASAQTSYPDRPIKMIVPLAAASAVDVAARIVTQNLPGASGLIGAEQVARAEPDEAVRMKQIVHPRCRPDAAPGCGHPTLPALCRS